MSDSEFSESPVQCERPKPKKLKEPVKRKSSTASAKSGTNEKSRSHKKKTPAPIFDVFNLQEGEPGSGRANSTPTSVLYNRVANGQTRRTAFLDGAFHVELKVFHAADVDAGGDDLWKKSLLTLKLRTDDDSPHWDRVQKFVKQASSLFEDSEATFYSNNIKFK